MFIRQTRAFKLLLDIKVQDIRFLHDPSKIVPLLPKERILGAYDIEKFIVEGFYLGAK